MAPPLVSIVIPAYKPHFLAQAIESALAQTHRPIEIIVSDNCPGDEVRALVARYPEARYVRNPVRGVYSNFRNCIRLARSEFVKFLLDDDLIEPRCIETLLRGFSDFADATLVTGWYHLVDAGGRIEHLRKLDCEEVLVSSPGGAGPWMLMSARNPVGPLTTTLFRRRSLPLGIGPWFFHTGAPERYFGLIDMAIILDLAFQGRAVMFPEPLSAMRLHDMQLSNPSENPAGIHSLKSWLPLAEDAHAFGLISDEQLQTARTSILALYRRFYRVYPSLREDASRLETKLAMGRQA